MTEPGPLPSSLTQLLQSWHNGDNASFDRVFDLAYAELRRIAAQRLRAAEHGATLSPTELLHEAVVRVIGSKPAWQNRAHFLASMSLYMRAVLVDHARARHSERRDGGVLHITLSQVDVGMESSMMDLLSLDSALQRLQMQDERSSSVLHLSYFAGLDRQEIAEVLKVSVQIVDRELRFAKSWLNAHIGTDL